jgi:hypothetical protein
MTNVRKNRWLRGSNVLRYCHDASFVPVLIRDLYVIVNLHAYIAYHMSLNYSTGSGPLSSHLWMNYWLTPVSIFTQIHYEWICVIPSINNTNSCSRLNFFFFQRSTIVDRRPGGGTELQSIPPLGSWGRGAVPLADACPGVSPPGIFLKSYVQFGAFWCILVTNIQF